MKFELIDNYKKIKKLQYWAKQTFLNEKGQEILPTLENLEVFEKELNLIADLIDVLKDDIHRKSEN